MADPNILNFGGRKLDELYNVTKSRDQVTYCPQGTHPSPSGGRLLIRGT